MSFEPSPEAPASSGPHRHDGVSSSALPFRSLIAHRHQRRSRQEPERVSPTRLAKASTARSTRWGNVIFTRSVRSERAVRSTSTTAHSHLGNRGSCDAARAVWAPGAPALFQQALEVQENCLRGIGDRLVDGVSCGEAPGQVRHDHAVGVSLVTGLDSDGKTHSSTPHFNRLGAGSPRPAPCRGPCGGGAPSPSPVRGVGELVVTPAHASQPPAIRLQQPDQPPAVHGADYTHATHPGGGVPVLEDPLSPCANGVREQFSLMEAAGRSPGSLAEIVL